MIKKSILINVLWHCYLHFQNECGLDGEDLLICMSGNLGIKFLTPEEIKANAEILKKDIRTIFMKEYRK